LRRSIDAEVTGHPYPGFVGDQRGFATLSEWLNALEGFSPHSPGDDLKHSVFHSLVDRRR
jgi:hypothetical protein